MASVERGVRSSEWRARNADRQGRFALCGWGAVVYLLMAGWLPAAGDERTTFSVATIRGRVVFFAEAMERRTGVPSVSEAQERVLALETAAGELLPLLEDVRGRAFRRDERLRKMDVELVVGGYQGAPLAQIIRVFELAKDGKYELDYWCDICAIAVFELKDCECCQGPVELRRRRVE